MASAIALCILASFAIAVAVNIGQGRRVACHCFGTIDLEPIGWMTLLSIALLAMASFVVVASPPPMVFSWSMEEVAAALLAAIGLFLLLLFLRVSPALALIWSKEGSPAPTAGGGRMSLRGLPLTSLEYIMLDRSLERSPCDTCSDRERQNLIPLFGKLRRGANR